MRARKVNCGFATGDDFGEVCGGVEEAESPTGGATRSADLAGTSPEFSLFGLSAEAESSAGFDLPVSADPLAESSCLGGGTDAAGLEVLFFTGATGADDAGAASAVAAGDDDGVCADGVCFAKTECMTDQTSSV